ncbi:protein ASPARTIC PROTEASE IN GUARD CELL 1-like [Solanum dulcamara]|uniref:protein ASPARTIC PROTEASE IN GUARD CELL 1-like n=1 Tax=Solanum dulcamara TaxID=45834 RepID=UPI002485C24A|nr:protein ASPARTIC PROTEASE IN GUARD CELL 1-like [Solanum dulcamara]
MSLDPFKLSDPPMSSYTFAIYHRDIFGKSNFKDFEDDNNTKEGGNSTFTQQQVAQGGNKIREKVPKTTGTYYANGEYVASFLLGSSEVRSFLLIDSDSDLLWWQCGPCEAKCYKQKQPLYSSTTSKTFRKIDCFRKPSSCMIKNPNLHCDQNSHECIYDLNYTDGSRTQGILADDVITFVLDHLPVRVTFGCARD